MAIYTSKKIFKRLRTELSPYIDPYVGLKEAIDRCWILGKPHHFIVLFRSRPYLVFPCSGSLLEGLCHQGDASNIPGGLCFERLLTDIWTTTSVIYGHHIWLVADWTIADVESHLHVGCLGICLMTCCRHVRLTSLHSIISFCFLQKLLVVVHPSMRATNLRACTYLCWRRRRDWKPSCWSMTVHSSPMDNLLSLHCRIGNVWSKHFSTDRDKLLAHDPRSQLGSECTCRLATSPLIPLSLKKE